LENVFFRFSFLKKIAGNLKLLGNHFLQNNLEKIKVSLF